MNMDHLIQELSEDLKPVVPLRSTLHRATVAAAISLAILFVGVTFWYWRKGELNLPTNRSLLEAILLLVSFTTAIWRAILSMSPHTTRIRPGRTEWLMLLLWAVVIGVAFYSFYRSDPVESLVALQYNTWACPIVTLSIGLPAAIGLFWYLKKGAALYPRNLALSWAVASVALGLLGLALICPWADPLHELLWHAAPAALGIGALMLFGRYLG